MQLFRSEDDVDIWSERTGYPKGAVFRPEQLWVVAKRWWDDRLTLEWQRKSVEARQAILEFADLTGDFWNLSASLDGISSGVFGSGV